MILVLAIVSVSVCLSVAKSPKRVPLRLVADYMKERLALSQQTAILYGRKEQIEVADWMELLNVNVFVENDGISVNERGNVYRAKTMTLAGEAQELVLKLWLGFGRLDIEP